MRFWWLLMSNSIKLIKPNDYLVEFDVKNSLYLNEFFDEKDFIKDEKVSDKTIDVVKDDDELDFAAMTDDEIIKHYNSAHVENEVIELGGRATYYLNNYIYDYYVKDSLLVVYGKLFYRLSSYIDANINTNIKNLIIDFELRFDTTNANLGQIDILNSIVKANVNNRISCNKPLIVITDNITFIPFHFGKVLPRNVKLIDSFKKEAFNFNDLQYLDYDWKPKFDGFDYPFDFTL